MKIVHVNPFFYPYRGGIEHRMHHICKILAEDHDVSIVTAQLPGTELREEMDGYEVIRLPSTFIGSYNPQYVISEGILETLEALSPDVVEFHYRWAPSYTRELMRYQGPKVFTWHNTYGEGAGLSQQIPSHVNDFFFLPKLKGFQSVTCVSDFVMRDLVERGADPEQLVSIPNSHQLLFPEEIPEEDDGFLLYVGRLVRTKGLDYLLRAMVDIDRELIICGKGPEMERLISLSKKLGVDDRVEFPGYVSDERRGELLSSCGAYVMPSIYESFGLAAAEAMVHGKAVIYGDVGGLPEVVRDAGIPVPPKSSAALVEAIENLFQDDARRKELGRKGREYAKEYSWEKAADMTLEQYRSII